MLPNGIPQRLGTYIDIPLEIALPHFVADDGMEEEGPLFGNFKLSLQSAVCHRGVSVDSGHYISLVRGHAPNAVPRTGSDDAIGTSEKDDMPRWMRFDDLAAERVTYVDIDKALKEESPYLLFYQIQPIDEDLARGAPPTYEEANSDPGPPPVDTSRETLSTADGTTSATRLSFEDDPRGRSSMSSARRSSIVLDDSSFGGSMKGNNTAPPTPLEDSKPSFLSASRRGSRVSRKSKSRPNSQSGENRLSITMSRLTGRMSRDKLQNSDANLSAGEEPTVVLEAAEDETDAELAAAGDKVKLSMSRNKSKKKEKEKEKRHRSTSRMPFESEGRKKEGPERECVIM